MKILELQDLWSHLKQVNTPILLYGMGNGADKILSVAEARGIPIADVFASDSFVRGQLFHGKRVLSYSEAKEKYPARIVLLAFGSSRKDVLENIYKIAAECELYAPDVPAFGNQIFDYDFYLAHKEELERTYALLADDTSKKLFENLINYKLSGKISYLLENTSEKTEIYSLLGAKDMTSYADLGAYTGDTVREFLSFAPNAQKIYALEPDARTFKKLALFAESDKRVLPYQVGAWSTRCTLAFEESGNRNASLVSSLSNTVTSKRAKEVEADALDNILAGARVDCIKFDVEGAESEALKGCRKTMNASHPALLVSLYHRSEDLFALPLQIHRDFPAYQSFYLRRLAGVPAWDIDLIVK